jgi:hypothetical protein
MIMRLSPITCNFQRAAATLFSFMTASYTEPLSFCLRCNTESLKAVGYTSAMHVPKSDAMCVPCKYAYVGTVGSQIDCGFGTIGSRKFQNGTVEICRLSPIAKLFPANTADIDLLLLSS